MSNSVLDFSIQCYYYHCFIIRNRLATIYYLTDYYISSYPKAIIMWCPLQCPPRTVRRLLDKNLAFHKAIAWMIIVSSVMHVIAHWYNYERLISLNADGTTIIDQWPWEPRFIPREAQPSVPPGVQPVSAIIKYSHFSLLNGGPFILATCRIR